MKTPSRIRFLLWILLTLPGWAVSAQDDPPPKSSIFQFVRGDLEKKKIFLREPPEGLKPWTGEQDQEEVQGQEEPPEAEAIEAGEGTPNDPEAVPPPPPVRRYGQFVTPRASQLPATSIPSPEQGFSKTFNKDHQLRSVTDPDGRTSSMQYHRQTGQPLRLVLPREAYEYAFDPETAQLTSIATRDAGIIVAGLDYEYEGPLLVEETWTGEVAGRVVYDFAATTFRRDAIEVHDTHGGQHRLATDTTQPLAPVLILDGTHTLRRHHSATRGLLETMVLDGRVTDTVAHNGFGQWESVTTEHVDTGQRYRVVLTYDGLGRIREKQEILFGSEHRRHAFAYDDAGRLIQVLDLDSNQPIAEYQYDVNGQRIAWSDAFGSGTPADVAFDAQDRLLRQGDITYTYNQSGQRLTKKQNGQTVTYDYDHLGNLRRVELPDHLVIEYLYDAWGRRIGKKVNGVLVQGFLYGNDALGPIAELGGDGNLKCFFLYGLTAHVPDAMLCGGQLYKVVKDPLGHVRLIDNVATGQAVQRLDYDPFGRVLLDTNPGFQPFGWAGGLYERQTGLIHFGARDYDPEIGRWTAKDPRNFAGGDTNLYAYAGNDPINNIDPTGEAFLPALLVGGWMIYDVVDSFLAWKDATDALGRYGFSQETLADWTLASGNLILSVLDGPTNAGALLRAAPNGGVLDRLGGFDDALGATQFGLGHSASSISGRIPGQGYRSFSAFKRDQGRAGKGLHWHHIVEQTPGNVLRFGPEVIHSTQNLMRLDAATHRQISAYYSRIQPFTEGQTVRQWLSTQSLSVQREFGLQVLRDFGAVP